MKQNYIEKLIGRGSKSESVTNIILSTLVANDYPNELEFDEPGLFDDDYTMFTKLACDNSEDIKESYIYAIFQVSREIDLIPDFYIWDLWDDDECTLVFSLKNEDWKRIKAIDKLWDKVEKFVKED